MSELSRLVSSSLFRTLSLSYHVHPYFLNTIMFWISIALSSLSLFHNRNPLYAPPFVTIIASFSAHLHLIRITITSISTSFLTPPPPPLPAIFFPIRNQQICHHPSLSLYPIYSNLITITVTSPSLPLSHFTLCLCFYA